MEFSRKTRAGRRCAISDFFSDDPGDDPQEDDFRIVRGEFVINYKNGVCSFLHHHIQDGAVEKTPFHTGFVFFKDQRLTLLGWRSDVFRIAIVNIPKGVWDGSSTVFQGGLVSVSKKGGVNLKRNTADQ